MPFLLLPRSRGYLVSFVTVSLGVAAGRARRWAWLILGVCWLLPAGRQALAGEMTKAADVRGLSVAEAGESRPVRLQGSVLLVTSPRDALVLLDDTDPIYVLLKKGEPKNYHPGDRLVVEGVTQAADFAPIVLAEKVTLLGNGPLPEPRPTTIAELNAGGFDAAWIEMEGIVRACVPMTAAPRPSPGSLPDGRRQTAPAGPAGERWLVNFAQGDDRMMITINQPVSPGDLIDATVRLRGVVFNVHNANRQFVRASVEVDNLSMITVMTPPPADPFALPVLHADEIMRFSRTGFAGHRVQVHGVITGHESGQTLWLRDGNRGLRVASPQGGELQPGDEVAVAGFPDHGGYAPSLSDAIFRKLAAGEPPDPQPLQNPEEISRQDSNLVQIDAELREVRKTADGVKLALDWKGLEVSARLLQNSGSELPPWTAGSRVRVAGICLLGQTSFSPGSGLWVAEDLQLLLRSAGDLAVLRPAPWLTTQRAMGIVVILAVAALVALVVVAVVARRQIAQREEARKLAEVEFSAMLAERNRLAREIHDTLAQDLNAVSMQLELAKNSARSGPTEGAVAHVNTAHGIVRKCLTEARESIWNMRSHILERTDLFGALQAVAEQMSAGGTCRIRARLQGKPRRLAPLTENNLLRIGQEAVANALKHARAGNIELELSFERQAVRLAVQDDGTGFDTTVVSPSGSHFGLQGMRERVEQMHGTFRIVRGEQGGTRVEVLVSSLT